MMSAGSIASEPYTKKKGVCPVALLGWVRSPQITIGNSASHLPPFLLVESKILFFKAIDYRSVDAFHLAVGSWVCD